MVRDMMSQMCSIGFSVSFPASPSVGAGRKAEHSGDVTALFTTLVTRGLRHRWSLESVRWRIFWQTGRNCDSSPATTHRLNNDHGQVISLVVIIESQAKYHSSRKILENSNHYEQMKGEMEKQLKSERTETGHSMAFTLMPLYAVGVALFAAYKFSKMQPKEKIGSKTSEGEEKKSKETENQLLVLEKHLLQTEKMLNSLLTQLDPLSSCVNSLATEQKDEIMNQLLSIRQLMKKSGMDKSTINNSAENRCKDTYATVGQSCEDTFENLIDSFRVQKSEVSGKDLSKLDAVDLELPVHDPVSEEPALKIDSHSKEDRSCSSSRELTAGHTSDGLRKRNIKD
ncbi:unnamed protein product [Ranitomeya imitator]|uniref:Resistance to inhibitors of cholinesterase protein 3 N-terminal domain-containing protein n=1 Tax=Ranitomeya imitator TaxID=111125 RepID=A0ABN9KS04_9NEOB|nr:unnamed protein product [Ranitomeya imitator]